MEVQFATAHQATPFSNTINVLLTYFFLFLHFCTTASQEKGNPGASSQSLTGGDEKCLLDLFLCAELMIQSWQK